jgi:hypothetical protein
MRGIWAPGAKGRGASIRGSPPPASGRSICSPRRAPPPTAPVQTVDAAAEPRQGGGRDGERRLDAVDAPPRALRLQAPLPFDEPLDVSRDPEAPYAEEPRQAGRVLPGERGDGLPRGRANVSPSLPLRGVPPEGPQDVVRDLPHPGGRRGDRLLRLLGRIEAQEDAQEIPVRAAGELLEGGSAVRFRKGQGCDSLRVEAAAAAPRSPRGKGAEDAGPRDAGSGGRFAAAPRGQRPFPRAQRPFPERAAKADRERRSTAAPDAASQSSENTAGPRTGTLGEGGSATAGAAPPPSPPAGRNSGSPSGRTPRAARRGASPPRRCASAATGVGQPLL